MMTEYRTDNYFCKIYTIIAILSPVLELYGISYSLHTFTWRFALVLAFSCLAFLNCIYTKSMTLTLISKRSIPFICSVVIGLLGNELINVEGGYELRVIRFLFLFIFAVILGQRYFDREFAMKVYTIIVWIATAVLLIQVISKNVFGTSFSGHLPLPLRSSIYSTANYGNRYYSIFEEPGYYGLFVGPYVCLKLLSEKINIIEIFLIAISLLLSTSTSNILVFAFLVVTYILFVNNKNTSKIKQIAFKIVIVILAIVAVYLFLQTPQYQFVLNRISGDSLYQRTKGYLDFNSYIGTNIFNWLFGNSLSAYPISGYATLIIAFGIVGSIAYLLMYTTLFFSTNSVGKYLLVFFLFINIGNVEFLGNASSMLIVFPFALSYCNQIEEIV